MAARSNTCVCGRWLAGTVGLKPVGGKSDSLVSVVCFQRKDSVSGGGAVPWETGLQAGRRRVRFLMLSFGIFHEYYPGKKTEG